MPSLVRGGSSHRLRRGLFLFLGALVPAVTCFGQAREPGLSEEEYRALREQMVEHQIERRGVRDRSVLRAMRTIPRHLFVPEELRLQAYGDFPLPIGHGQTISQPYIVALMSEALELGGDEKVLEIGTGSGYQAAILGELAARVFSIEIVAPLAERASLLLAEMGYGNVETRTGDGYAGWPEEAPFDAIILTAAPAEIPAPLIEQLAVGGRLLAPVGEEAQELVLVSRDREGLEQRSLIRVRFVPMTGEAQN